MWVKRQSILLVVIVMTCFCWHVCVINAHNVHSINSLERHTNTTISTTLRGPHTNPNGRKTLATKHALCGTPSFDANVMRRINDIAKKKKAGTKVQQPSSILVKTRYIVITDAFGNGDVDDSELMNVNAGLNTNYAAAGSKFRFKYLAASRVIIANAVDEPVDNYLNQLGRFRRGGLDTLNIFVVPNMSNAGFVIAWIGSGDLALDGVFLSKDYLSDTTPTHEVGHWLGIAHVFDSAAPYDKDACNPKNPQDYIADTPQVRAATPFGVGCGNGRDTCPNIPGLDPTNNYMDYGDEYDPDTGSFCKTKFTPGQVARMHDVWYYYRMSNEVCAINEMQVTFKIRFDAYPWEITWNITLPDGTLVHDSLYDRAGGSLGSGHINQTATFTFCLIRRQHVFHIYDSYGDGIDPPGYYELRVNGQLMARGGQEFDYETAIILRPVGQRPTLKPVRRPTKRPT